MRHGCRHCQACVLQWHVGTVSASQRIICMQVQAYLAAPRQYLAGAVPSVVTLGASDTWCGDSNGVTLGMKCSFFNVFPVSVEISLKPARMVSSLRERQCTFCA